MLFFAPEIALRVERSDPAQNFYFTSHFSNARFKCKCIRPLCNCGNIKLLYGRGQGEAQTRYSTDDRSELWHDSQPWQNRILLSLLSYDIPHVNMQKKFGKNGFHTLQGTMSHRPLTNTSSLKIPAAYCTLQKGTTTLTFFLTKWSLPDQI